MARLRVKQTTKKQDRSKNVNSANKLIEKTRNFDFYPVFSFVSIKKRKTFSYITFHYL